jgi:hypothetical protein
MSWLIIRAITGERFLCKCDANLADAVINRKTVQVKEVYEVVTMNLMSMGMPSRLTTLAYVDFQSGEPLPMMHLVPAAWYTPDQGKIKQEIEELKRAKEKAEEMRAAMESNLTQVQAVPAVAGGIPPGIGSLFGQRR